MATAIELSREALMCSSVSTSLGWKLPVGQARFWGEQAKECRDAGECDGSRLPSAHLATGVGARAA